ncbi:MAG TPA: response regulator [Burkholderiales bacterium]|nr:response regulator [Burkholderiales bacterium]
MSSARESVTVLDDDVLVLRALDRLLQSAGYAVETYSSAGEFLRRCAFDAPGCIVMDLSLPLMSGLDLQHALAMVSDARPLVFISGHGTVPSSVEAMKAGAVDFLTKPVDGEKLLAAVRAALAKDHAAREQRSEQASVTARLCTLTPREREVLAGVVAGKLNKQIAAELGTAEKTIKVHRARMMRKMEVGSLAELVRAWTVTQPPLAA